MLTLSPGQTIATCQCNISLHCWAQHVACVWPPCCDLLHVVGSSLKIVKFEPTTPNMSQHIATGWQNAHNMLRPTMLRYVALAWFRSFGQGLNFKLTFQAPASETIATFQRNISQHCWTQHVARVWPSCCDVLRHVGCCWLKFETGQIFNATVDDLHDVVVVWPGSC